MGVYLADLALWIEAQEILLQIGFGGDAAGRVIIQAGDEGRGEGDIVGVMVHDGLYIMVVPGGYPVGRRCGRFVL